MVAHGGKMINRPPVGSLDPEEGEVLGVGRQIDYEELPTYVEIPFYVLEAEKMSTRGQRRWYGAACG